MMGIFFNLRCPPHPVDEEKTVLKRPADVHRIRRKCKIQQNQVGLFLADDVADVQNFARNQNFIILVAQGEINRTPDGRIVISNQDFATRGSCRLNRRGRK